MAVDAKEPEGMYEKIEDTVGEQREAGKVHEEHGQVHGKLCLQAFALRECQNDFLQEDKGAQDQKKRENREDDIVEVWGEMVMGTAIKTSQMLQQEDIEPAGKDGGKQAGKYILSETFFQDCSSASVMLTLSIMRL